MGLGEGALFAGIPDERLKAVALRQRDPLGIVVEDEEREFFPGEVAGQYLPDAPVTTNDGMILDGFDVPGFSMFFHSFSYFSFGDEADQ